jgi:hypothetical protein
MSLGATSVAQRLGSCCFVPVRKLGYGPDEPISRARRPSDSGFSSFQEIRQGAISGILRVVFPKASRAAPPARSAQIGGFVLARGLEEPGSTEYSMSMLLTNPVAPDEAIRRSSLVLSLVGDGECVVQTGPRLRKTNSFGSLGAGLHAAAAPDGGRDDAPR